jgi:hypothetical protein
MTLPHTLILSAVLTLAACTTTTGPDGSRTTGPDGTSVTTAGSVIIAYLESRQARPVHADK